MQLSAIQREKSQAMRREQKEIRESIDPRRLDAVFRILAVLKDLALEREFISWSQRFDSVTKQFVVRLVNKDGFVFDFTID